MEEMLPANVLKFFVISSNVKLSFKVNASNVVLAFSNDDHKLVVRYPIKYKSFGLPFLTDSLYLVSYQLLETDTNSIPSEILTDCSIATH